MLNIKTQVKDLSTYGTRTYSVGNKFYCDTAHLVPSLVGFVSVRSERFDTAEEAKANLEQKVKDLKAKEENLIQNPLQLMEHLCQHHDWSYQFSDDGSKYDQGSRTERLMRLVVGECGDPARKIWNDHAPSGIFKCHN